MEETIVNIVVAFVVGGGLTALITLWFGRQRAKSESGMIDSESNSLMSITIKTFQDIYQDLMKDQMVRISRLEAEQAASGTRIVGLETIVSEQRELIGLLRAEITQLKEQIVTLGHVPETAGDK